MQAPIAKKINKELSIHQHTRIDPYYWLNERENPEVIQYLEAENAYTRAMMKDTEALQETLFKEIIGRIKQTDMSVPYFKNGYFYYVRYDEGKEYAIHCRKKGSLDSDEEIMLDVNQLAEGHDFFQLGSFSVSPDNTLLAYSTDTLSRRIYTIHFKNLLTNETLSETISNTSGKAVWANDNKTVFYSVKDEQTLRPYQIYSYSLGDVENTSKLVFEETDETFTCFVYKTRSKKFIVIGSSSTLSDEYRIIPADTPFAPAEIFHPRERGLEYSFGHIGNEFYIRTNLAAVNFRLMKTREGKTPKENWQEVIAERKDVFIEGLQLFAHHMVVEERVKGQLQLRIINFETQQEHYLDFNEEAFTVWFGQNAEMDTPVVRIGYTSLTVPATTYDYHMDNRSLTLLKQQEILGGYEPNAYQSERHMAIAKDNTEVPISLVYKKGTPLDGSAPLLLYGYGSYGHSMDPFFSLSRLSLLDRGFIFAIAHIRGGQDMGRPWYEAGKLFHKKNTFTDFIDCAEHLLKIGYTTKDKLLASGGSAGGLLIGAVINMRPELFKGVIASVPFVDVVTTMLDESIPLTTGEYDEWGNPNSKEYYEYMLSYSPYDNVEAKAYPHMLVTTGLHDSQVQYWEPAKWVARLRDVKTDDHMLLLETNMETGHSGASGRFAPYKETALDYAFLIKCVE